MLSQPKQKPGNIHSFFGLDQDSSYLLIGPEFKQWGTGCSRAVLISSVDEVFKQKARYDIIAVSTTIMKEKKELESIIRYSETILSERGIMIMLAKNIFSPDVLKAFVWGNRRDSLGINGSYSRFSKIVKNSSFRYIYSFLPFPYLSDMRELVAKNSAFLEIPHYSSVIKRLAFRIGIYGCIHNGFVFICKKQDFFKTELFVQTGNVLRDYFHLTDIEYRLERFDFRERGALVLFVTERLSSKQFIIRIVSDAETKGIVEKNHTFLSWFHQEEMIPDTLKKKVPLPLANFLIQDSSVFIETLLPGVVAWKTNNSAKRQRIYKDTLDFSMELAIHTKTECQLDSDDLKNMFSEDRHRIANMAICGEKFLSLVYEIIEIIVKKLAGKHVWLATSHGDYGFGNVLVDNRDGRLRGVIDWDTGRSQEFPAVDVFNMIIQRERIERNTGLAGSVSGLITRDNFGLPLYVIKLFETELGLGSMLMQFMFSIAIIRYISRSAQYPAVFKNELNDYHDTLQIVRRILAL